MKKSFLAACVAVALCGNAVFAITPGQDKPMSKTTTTSTSTKKSMPAATKSTTTTKTTHTKHTKQS